MCGVGGVHNLLQDILKIFIIIFKFVNTLDLNDHKVLIDDEKKRKKTSYIESISNPVYFDLNFNS